MAPIVRARATATKARNVTMRAGEEKPLARQDSLRNREKEVERPACAQPPKQDVDGLERGSIERPEPPNPQATMPRSTAPPSGRNPPTQNVTSTFLNPDSSDVKDEREPPSKTASAQSLRSKPPTRPENREPHDTPASSFERTRPPLGRSQSESGSSDFTPDANASYPRLLLDELDRLRAANQHKDTENARYLDALNESRETMQLQSDKLRAKDLLFHGLNLKMLAEQQRSAQASSRARDLQARLEHAGQKLELANRERELESQKVELASRKLELTSQKLEQANRKLDEALRRAVQLDGKWKESAAEVAALRQQGAVHKVDDATLKATYGEIVYAAANWASNYCSGGGGGRDIPTIHDADLTPVKSLTRHYRQYVASTVLRPVLVQSLLMKLLVEHVLRYSDEEANGMLWAGRVSPGLRLVQKALEYGDGYATEDLLRTGTIRPPQVQSFAAWKATSAQLVADRASQSDIDFLIADKRERFRAILSPFLTCAPSTPAIWTDLSEIIATAVRLDREMSKSRALFTFDGWSGAGGEAWGFEFDEGTCEAAGGFEGGGRGRGVVELVVAPFFMKTGTGDGEAYERSLYLAKCLVVCTESRRKMESF